MKHDPIVVDRLIAGTMRVKDAHIADRDDPGTIATTLRCNTGTVLLAIRQAAEKTARRAALAVTA